MAIVIGSNGRLFNNNPNCPHGSHRGYGSYWSCRCHECLVAGRAHANKKYHESPKPPLNHIRQWAMDRGMEISLFGAVPFEIVEQYEGAIGGR